MTDLPEPFVSAECDLKDFAFTPIYRARLFGSSFHSHATDSEWRAGVTLWLKSQDQSPAGSLPDDDVELCRLAELGRDLKAWRKLRVGALHGWVTCSDGRLYNKVVAEVVKDQWQGKIDQRNKTLKARIAALEKRLSQTESAAVKADIESLLQDLRHALSQNQKRSVTEDATGTVTASKGQGQGERQGEGLDKPPIPPRGAERFAEFWKAYPHRGDHPDPEAPARVEFLRALENGCSVDAIIAGAGAYAAAIRADSVEPRYVLTAKKWLRGGCWDGAKPQLRADAPAEVTEHYALRRALDRFRENGFWMPEVYGPKPGEPGCRIPRDLLVEKVA